MSGANLFQEGVMRVIYTRFRACSDQHRDVYHAECQKCLLIESSEDRCIDTSHVRDGGGKCLTCELFDGKLAYMSAKDESRLHKFITKYKGKL